MSSKAVERFEPYVDYSAQDNGEPDMRPAKDGDWRRNEDYERLEKERDKLRDLLVRCRDVVDFVDSLNDEGGEFTEEDEQLLSDIDAALAAREET